MSAGLMTRQDIFPSKSTWWRIVDGKVCNPCSGVITGVFEVPLEPDDPRVFCFMAEVARAERISGAMNEIWCSAAGLDRDAAARSAIGEGIERYCAAHYEDVPLLLARYADLPPDQAIAPEEFALFGDHQFGEDGLLVHPDIPSPKGSNADEDEFANRLREFRPSKFKQDTLLRWVWAFDLSQRREVLVPASLVFMSPRLADREAYIWDAISTGLACGPSPAHAVLHAVLEVIERDAVKINWANRLSRARILPERDPNLASIFEERFAVARLRYHLFDVTLDLPGVAVFGILEDLAHDTYIAAAACRLSAKDAVLKVATELSQGRIGMKRVAVGRRPKEFRPDFLDVFNFDDHAWAFMQPNMRQHLEFLLGGSTSVTCQQLEAEGENAGIGNTQYQVSYLVSELAAKGLRTLVVDLTTEDLAQAGYTVVKVLIPGLQDIDYAHARCFQGGNRLFDVPSRLGFRDRRSTVDEFNPIPHPMP